MLQKYKSYSKNLNINKLKILIKRILLSKESYVSKELPMVSITVTSFGFLAQKDFK